MDGTVSVPVTPRLDLDGRHLVLGLSGGIACYKSAELLRLLVKAGATVQVVMSEAAEHFITATTMQALSNRAVVTSQWDAREPNAKTPGGESTALKARDIFGGDFE